jgi:hypothetical protein
VSGAFLHQAESLFYPEKRHFVVIDSDSDDQLVEYLERASCDVKMPVGDGIESAGINGAAHGEGNGKGDEMQ